MKTKTLGDKLLLVDSIKDTELRRIALSVVNEEESLGIDMEKTVTKYIHETKNPKKIYLASSWRNVKQPEILDLLRSAGHEVYDFRNPKEGNTGFSWSDIDPEWQNWSADGYRENLLNNPIAALGFQHDMRAMQWADTCVLLLPCGRSAHLEAGWFCGMGKRCIILTQDGEEPELMALMATDIAVNENELIDLLK